MISICTSCIACLRTAFNWRESQAVVFDEGLEQGIGGDLHLVPGSLQAENQGYIGLHVAAGTGSRDGDLHGDYVFPSKIAIFLRSLKGTE